MSELGQRTIDFAAPWLGQGNYDQAFEAWLATEHGQAIYAECARRALQIHERGFRHFGIRCIWESIRFDWIVQGRDRDGLKCNDHFHSRVARRLMRDHPELAGLFELRRLKT